MKMALKLDSQKHSPFPQVEMASIRMRCSRPVNQNLLILCSFGNPLEGIACDLARIFMFSAWFLPTFTPGERRNIYPQVASLSLVAP